MDIFGIISLIASFMTIVLFSFYFVGRIITIFSMRKRWDDKIIFDLDNKNEYGIVEEIYLSNADKKIYGMLIPKEGIRNLRVYNVVEDENGLFTKKGEKLLERPYLKANEAVAFRVELGDLFPTLIIEYNAFDYMSVQIEWRSNLKNDVISELIVPKHNLKSFFYYLLK